MRHIKIGEKLVGRGQPAYIIAEAGVNHNGQLDLALRLVDAAAEAGADAVKFQTFKASEVTTASGQLAEYQKKNLGTAESQTEMLRKLEMPGIFYGPIIARCREKGITFLSTPHGHIQSLELINRLGVEAFKLGSGDLTNRPLLERTASFKKPMILGTGMATMKEVIEALHWVNAADNQEVIFLHCTTSYPCPPEEVNLKAMQSMAETLPEALIGYSDHTLGSQASIMAVMLGAVMLEKHLTLDNRLPGPDHCASADSQAFKEMVEAVRRVPAILGSNVKRPTQSELPAMSAVRKSLVSLAPIKRGEKFNPSNLGVKRPGNGISPKMYKTVLGKTAKRDIAVDVLIEKGDW